MGHAHTVVGAYSIKDAAGTVTNRLIRIRNPWGSDSYTGPWYDGDSRWTAAIKAQVPYANSNEGYFFIEVNDFILGFYYFTINYMRDTWRTNYYEKLSDDGSLAYRNFTFTLARA